MVSCEKERIVNHEIHEQHEKKKRINKTEDSEGYKTGKKKEDVRGF